MDDFDDFIKALSSNNSNNSEGITSLTNSMFLISIIPKLFNEKERNNVYNFCKLLLKLIGISDKIIEKYYADFEKSCKNSYMLYRKD